MEKFKEHFTQYSHSSSPTNQYQNLLTIQHTELQLLTTQKQKIIQLIKKLNKTNQQLKIVKKQNQKYLQQIKIYHQHKINSQNQLNTIKNLHLSQLQSLKSQNLIIKSELNQLQLIHQNLKHSKIQLQTNYWKDLSTKTLQIQRLLSELSTLRTTSTPHQQSLQQLTHLLQRQNTALKLQNAECQHLFKSNQNYQNIFIQMKKQLISMQQYKLSTQQYIQQMNNNIHNLTNKITKQTTDWSILMQIQQIREQMRQQTKSQMKKIQYIISQF